MYRVLQKSIIVPFYRSHAGLLIFVFLILFGTVESRYLADYHRTLILGMFTSEILMISVCLIWTLYSLKILQYILSLLRKPEYNFLNTLMLISSSKSFGLFFFTTAVCFLPVLVYTIFIYIIGISQTYYFSSGFILLFQVVLCCLNALVIQLFLQTQHKFSWMIMHIRIPNICGRIGFYISHFASEEKVALLISKTFSLALLYIVREAMDAGDDFRILGLTWVFVLLAHTFLIPKVKMFEDRYLNGIKALPISTTITCLMYFVFYAGLMLPELIFSITMTRDVFDFLSLVLLSGTLLMFIHAYLFKPGRDPDKFSTYLFWLFMASFLVILSKMILVLVVMLGVTAFIRITQRYYLYESGV